MKKTCVVGEGAWGTAIALLLARNGYNVSLWCHDPRVVDSIITTGYNERYLPRILLPHTIHATADLAQAIEGADYIFEAIPVQFLRSIFKDVLPYCKPTQTWVLLSKGLEQDTLLFPSQILQDVFGYQVKHAVVAGPSFARDVAHEFITAVTIAADCHTAQLLQPLMNNHYFKTYITTDMIGVQAGAALKNSMALCIGMLRGAEYSDNAQAFLITRGFHEMVRITLALGGHQETMYGLSGIGDLILTCNSMQSKNLQVGVMLGAGETLPTILKKTGYIPEGINTVKAMHQMMQEKKLDLPICRGMYQVIFENKPLKQFLDELMAIPETWECVRE
jgi:Glycerol-3-phosphate dehydrogenase